jgi:hypothetical protein
VKLVRASIVLTCALVYFTYVFRLTSGDFLTAGLGDWVDPYFINALLEHWHHSLLTLTDPASPPMYFPASSTLGYSHGLILYAPIYIVCRIALNPFLSYNLTMLLVVLIGSMCLYVFVRKVLALSFLESLVLTAFFCTSRNVINGGSGHWSQRLSVFLIAPVLLLAFTSAAIKSTRWTTCAGWLTGFAGVLLFTQDFYTAQLAALMGASLLAGLLIVSRRPLLDAAWELWRVADVPASDGRGRSSRRPSRWWLIVGCVAAIWGVIVLLHPFAKTRIGPLVFSATDPTRPLLIAVVLGGWFVVRLALLVKRRRDMLRSPLSNGVIEYWQQYRRLLLSIGAGGLAGACVFCWIYVGPYREHHAFPESQLFDSLVSIPTAELFRPSDVIRLLTAYDSARTFILVMFVCVVAWSGSSVVRAREREFSLWFVIVSLGVLLVAFNIGGFSIWRTFLAPVPGFAVIRDPKRIIPLYELAAMMITGVFMMRLPPDSHLRGVMTVVLMVLIVADWNTERFGFGRANAAYAHWIEAPIEVDPSCRSFYIKRASDDYTARSLHMWSLYGVDSLFVSLNHSIPTLNGYSAWMPSEWHLANPPEPGYPAAVTQWADQHGLTAVCELDIDRRTITRSHDMK